MTEEQTITGIKYEGMNVFLPVHWSHTETRKALSKLGKRYYLAQIDGNEFRAYMKIGRKWEEIAA